MIKALQFDIVVHLDNGVHPPTTLAECYRAGLQTEYYVNKDKGKTGQSSQGQSGEKNRSTNANQSHPQQSQNWKKQGSHHNKCQNFQIQKQAHNNNQGGGPQSK